VGALAGVGLDADEGDGGGGGEGLELEAEFGLGAGAVFEVNEGPIVAGVAHEFGGVGGAEAEEAAEEGFAVGEAGFEVGGGVLGGHGGDCNELCFGEK